MSEPTLEQDVTAWQAIEKARYTLDTLLKLNGLDTRSETLVIEALAKLAAVKHYINARRTQRIDDASKASK